MNRARPLQGGFTLLEVLVALVVLGLLMLALTQGVRAGLALEQAQTRRLATTAELDATMRVLRGVLTRLPVVPAGYREGATAAGAGIQGEADRLSFVGNLPTGLGAHHRADIALYVHDGRLILAWKPHYHERPLGPASPYTETVLLDGVKRLQLAYWGSPGRGQPPAWQATWKDMAAPDLIRLRLVFGRSDPRSWPDLIAASRL